MLYFVQQRMVAARAAVSPTMSPAQQKLMQYLPVVFAVFQVFFLAGLVIYYMAQAMLRIGQQAYITRRFYGHDEALGRQAQRASEQARELAKTGRRRRRSVAARLQARRRPTTTDAPAPAKADAAGKNGRRRAAASGDDEAHDRAEGPADADRQGRHGAPNRAAVGTAGRQPQPRAAANDGADRRRDEP